MRFIFFGSSEFAEIILKQLLESGMKPILVITAPSPTPVYNLAEQNDIPVLIPENLSDQNFLADLKRLKPDLAILTAYGKIIPPELLAIPAKGFINLHPSLLPRWRGATPIQSAILTGDTETGDTLFLMDEQIDHGPIIQNTVYRIQNTDITYEELMNKLAILGAKLIIETLPKWLEGKITPLAQDESLTTYCHKITKQDEKIDWKKTNIQINRKVRALNPQPGVFTKVIHPKGNELILKIIKGYPANDTSPYENKTAGEIFVLENKLAVKCGKGIYVIEELKPAGKNTMTSMAYLRGNKWILNQTFNSDIN